MSDAELGHRDARLERIRGYGRPQAQPSLQSLVRCQANHRNGHGVCSPSTALSHDRRRPRYTQDKHDKALLLCQRAHTSFPDPGRSAHPERGAARAGEAHGHIRQARRRAGRQLAGGRQHYTAALPGLVAVRAAGTAAPRALAALLRRRQEHRRHARGRRRAHRPAAQRAAVSIQSASSASGGETASAAHRQRTGNSQGVSRGLVPAWRGAHPQSGREVASVR